MYGNNRTWIYIFIWKSGDAFKRKREIIYENISKYKEQIDIILVAEGREDLISE